MVSLYAELYSNRIVPIINTSINISGNNISSDINNITNNIAKSTEIFLLGKSKFKDEKFYANDKVNYFISSAYPNEQGVLEQTVEIEFYTNVNAKSIMLFVVFDTKNQAYPNVVEINGITYKPKSAVLPLLFNSSVGVANKIKFDTWNKQDVPVIIQGISTSFEIESANLSNVSFTSYDRSDFNVPSWGIKSNSGSLELRDTYGLITPLADIIESNDLRLNFYLKCFSKKEQIGSFVITNMSYNKQNGIGNIEVKDVLYNWEQITLPYMPLKSLLSLYSVATNLNSPRVIQPANDETYKHLSNILIKNPYMEEGSVWANWVKICELSGCYIYCNEKGEPTIRYGGGT